MPAGAAVVDAFKNLIRHGKHHNNASKDEPASPTTSTSPTTATSPVRASRHKEKERERELPAQPSQQQQQQQQPQQEKQKQEHVVKADMVETIVHEERKAKDKMPTYKGLEDYKLEEKMGDGAFSNVYKATQISTGKKVAVKVVRKYELNASQAGEKHLNAQFKKKPRVTERANILKEVQIMRGTSHPSIVKLYSFSESEEFYFLVLELMPGGELFHQIVKLTYFSENLARHVILEVARGIRYLHEERGVVHRDIKPENLLFERIPIIPSKNPVKRPYDEEKEDEGEFIPGVGGGGIGRVKIADFGLSKVVWNEETMTPCGTVGYTAPEIVKDERYSKSVDMWAMGCVLYTLLCGFPPFYDESINVLTEKVARGYYTFLSPWWDDISHSAKDLITHLLCVDPAQRYTIDEFLAHPWCNAAPAPAPPPTPFMYPHLKENRPLDSPLLRGNGKDGRSPGINALKEAFDVTYAVHRMEEEGARRRKYQGRGAGGRGFLSGLNEDDEEGEYDGDSDSDGEADDEDNHKPPAPLPQPQQKMPQQPPQPTGSLLEGRAGPRDQGRGGGGRGRVVQAAGVGAAVPGSAAARAKEKRTRGGRQGFELDIHNATLLGRRNKGNNMGSPLKMEMAGIENTLAPQPVYSAGSPMHL
ncbi:kinase-like domain-containing protein [Crepidotus variabilis]|uniref:Kinase-like domain-containing protein n=1 Tax=Crepidotus variabilis TaxID=179855 RepID=A0A9P6EUK3_9AGAR|nr:kinase-like domain-containing protein [Crepidotus variabilis]